MSWLRSNFFQGFLFFIVCAFASYAQWRYRIAWGDARLLLWIAGAAFAGLAIILFVQNGIEDMYAPDDTLMVVLQKLRLVFSSLICLYACYGLFLFLNAQSLEPEEPVRGTVTSAGSSLTFVQEFVPYSWAQLQLDDGKKMTLLLTRQEASSTWPGLAIEASVKPGLLGVPQIETVSRNAEMQFTEILAVAPTSTIALEKLMMIYAETNRMPQALELVKRFLNISKDADTPWRVGAKLFQKGQVAASLEFFKLVHEKSPTQDHTISVGWALAKLGRRKEGLPYLQKGMELDPVTVNGHYHLGYVQAEMGLREEAINSFSEVLKRKPNYPEIREELRKLGAAQ